MNTGILELFADGEGAISLSLVISVFFFLWLNGRTPIWTNRSYSAVKILWLLIVAVLVGNIVASGGGVFEVAKSLQMLLMVGSLILVYVQRESLQRSGLSKDVDGVLNGTVLATASALIISEVVYERFGIVIGKWTFYPGRTVVDLFFTGYSVASVYLGIGLLVNGILLFERMALSNLVGCTVCLIAISINSSRTGLVASLACLIVYMSRRLLKDVSYILKALIFMIIGGVSAVYVVRRMLSSRETSTLFDDNGRFETYTNALSILFSSLRTIGLGEGFDYRQYAARWGVPVPHNLVLECILQVGLPVTLALVFLGIRLLMKVEKSVWRYALLEILISSMVITNFPGDYYFTGIGVIGLISREKMTSHETDWERGQMRNHSRMLIQSLDREGRHQCLHT